LLPPRVRLDAAVRARWSGVGGVAACAIGGTAATLAVRAAPTTVAAFGVPAVALIPAVALSAGLATWSAVRWLLGDQRSSRATAGVVAGVSVALASHPIAWAIAMLVTFVTGGGFPTGSGLGARSVASVLAVGWFTVPLCALGGYWVGRRFATPVPD
jgi:hypothetical protein